MFRNGSPSPLVLFEGDALCTAAEVIVKGQLESETPVSLVAGPRVEPFDGVFRLGADAAAAEMLRSHELRLVPTPSASRAVTLVAQTARSGRAAVALVPNAELSDATPALARVARVPREGALCVLLEDRPGVHPESCPVRLARRLDFPAVMPGDLEQLLESMESVFRVSRAGGCAVALIVHGDLLRSIQTLTVRPNRVIESVDAMLARRRRGRRPRFVEAGDVLRIVRRLEFNRGSSLPSPGERTPVGFITVGAAGSALGHLTRVLQLVGRVPALHLGAVHPIDGAAVSRLLSRCEEIVVLEPRPGAVRAAVLEVSESMRAAGERPGVVRGDQLPPDEPGRGETRRLRPDDAIHPSLLARAIVHLLHRIRPGGEVASRLLPDRIGDREPPAPPRGATVGVAAALTQVRRLVVDVDQWLRERDVPDEPDAVPPTSLAIDGVVPASSAGRIVMVETWDSTRFEHEGIDAVRQAARDDVPWIFVLCEIGGDDVPDLERLARGVIPAERTERVRIVTANLTASARFVEILREAALEDALTIVVVRDGPPAAYDVAEIERAFGEIDRLGYEPRQYVTWPADRACAVRQPRENELVIERLELDKTTMRTELRVDRVPRRGATFVRLRVRPLLEQAEVDRTRPPARRWRRDPDSMLPLPEIVHRRAPLWRVHLAGFGGAVPGWTARILAHAGRAMGYRVGAGYDPTPIGAGRRAWAHLVFTRPRESEARRALTTRIPFGEADLVLGVDAVETLRAIADEPALRVAHLDRTHAVVNVGHFGDEADTEQAAALRARLADELAETTHPGTRIVDDFAGACRAWFHTDRVVNVAVLGAAFQAGLVPVTVDALEAAVAAAEANGFGRAREAFRFGRHLAIDRGLFARPKDDREEDAGRLVRRLVHLLSQRGERAQRVGERLGAMMEKSLEAMPGLSETDVGRQSRRDFVLGLYRCHHWGGVEYAERFARLITDLYAADRGDAGRALTRAAVLPLAAGMLIRDTIFVASMATSSEHRRRVRRVLNVKRARGDELQRRYLTRLEFVAFGRRYRADVRTSDWLARVAAAGRRVVVAKWRGSRRQRDLRDYLIDLVERATTGAAGHYEHFQSALTRVHQQAVDGRLRGMAISELRMFAEPGEPGEPGAPGERAAPPRPGGSEEPGAPGAAG